MLGRRNGGYIRSKHGFIETAEVFRIACIDLSRQRFIFHRYRVNRPQVLRTTVKYCENHPQCFHCWKFMQYSTVPAEHTNSWLLLLRNTAEIPEVCHLSFLLWSIYLCCFQFVYLILVNTSLLKYGCQLGFLINLECTILEMFLRQVCFWNMSIIFYQMLSFAVIEYSKINLDHLMID